MQIEKYVLGAFEENAYLIFDKSIKEAIVIDPGESPSAIIDSIHSKDLKLKYILNTHAHIDHVLGVEEVKNATGAPFYLNEEDIPLLNALPEQAEMFDLNGTYNVPDVEGNLKEGDVFELGDNQFKVISTPGHSPGSVSFVTDGIAFVGDVLFAGSVGRVDLPGGSWEILRRSITEKICVLERDCVIYSGHGPDTSVGKEIDNNPFLQPGFEF